MIVAAVASAALAVAWSAARGARPAAPQPAAPLRFATFNIEHFPEGGDRQVEGAFDEIVGLDAAFVAVEEITDAPRFAAAATRRLGPAWRFVHSGAVAGGDAEAAFPTHHVGVLFDGARFAEVDARNHPETAFGGKGKAVLDVLLRPRDGGALVRVLVVHLKSGSDGRDLRRRQLRGLARVLRGLPRDGARVVVLGDFNATEPSDRDQIAAVAAAAGLTWATEPLACSAFWDRDDGCPTSRLDHALTWAPPSTLEARGACAQGCERRDSCPLWSHEVSDHCPVLLQIDP